MSLIHKILFKYEKIGVRLSQLLLTLLIIIRVRKVIIHTFLIDFKCYVTTAKLIREGISPYSQEIAKANSIQLSIQPPSMSLLLMPWLEIPPSILSQLYVFFCIAVYFLFVLMVFNYYGFGPTKVLSPKWRNLPALVSMTMVCISFPFFMMLKCGQISAITAFLLFFVLFYPKNDRLFNIFMLALSAATKYSLLTFSVPIMLLQKRWKTGIMAFTLFALLILSVGLWLDGIVQSFHEYISLLAYSTRNSISYELGHDESFIHIGFFKANWINCILTLGLLTSFIGLLKKLTKRQDGCFNLSFPMRLTAIEWGIVSLCTLLFSYHRLYDGILVMPFLGVALVESFNLVLIKKNKTEFGKFFCLLCLMFFWASPQKYINILFSKIGSQFPYCENILYYSSTRVNESLVKNIIPGYGIMMVAMLCVFLWIEFTRPNDMRKTEEEYNGSME